MTTLQTAAGYLIVALVMCVLLGLLRRGLWRLARAFVGYLCAVALCALLVRLWPERFFNLDFFVVKEGLYGALKLGVALEIAALSFARLPGARRAAGLALGSGVLLLALVLVSAALPVPDATRLTERLVPRLANGTALLLAAVWALALWFHVPLHPLHRALLRGFVPYLLVFTVLLNLLRALDWEIRLLMGLADSAAYATMMAYWAWTVWNAPLAPPGRPGVVEALQPWRFRK